MNETLPLVTAARRRRAERRARVKELAAEGLSTREIGAVLGVGHATVARDVSSETVDDQRPSKNQGVKEEVVSDETISADFERETPAPSRVAEFVARAHTAVVETLPMLGAREVVEFHARVERVAGHARRLGDAEAERRCQDLCRRLERAVSTIVRQG
jgi:hypothetical protein